MDLPLFPLHTVLCPGVALPLHVFEDRYKAMIQRCLTDKSPFGVVLIREGREVGGGDLAVAGIGTVAEIREARRYRDGRYDLVTLGTQRFRLEAVDPEAEPYLIGQVTPLGEVLGEAGRARALGDRVMQLFIQYLELLQVDEQLRKRRGLPTEPQAIAPDDLSEALDAGVVEEGDQAAEPAADLDVSADAATTELPDETDVEADDAEAADAEAADRARAEFLTEAARQLTIPEDPTVLSYLLSGIVQIESIRRQVLLEMPTTESRLEELAHLLDREIALLQRGLGSYVPDPRLSMLRRN
jgi:Lon protease-like protein